MKTPDNGAERPNEDQGGAHGEPVHQRGMLDAALEYARRGWCVFPVEPNGKRPQKGVKWGSEATTDPDTIRRWWAAEPNANIGIACGPSRLCVLDVDDVSGEQFLKHHDVPETLEVRTGKGRHLYFTGTATSVNRAFGDDIGIDRKSLGGYVVAPPSVHESGRRYEWSDPDIELAEAPKWFLEASRKAAKPSVGTPKLDTANGDAIPEGSRNDFLSKLAYSMRKSGMAPDEIVPALMSLNQGRCKPPLERAEVEAIARGKANIAPKGAGGAPFGSELWFAHELVSDHAESLKHVGAWHKWMAWRDGEGCWERDPTGAHWRAAKETHQRLLHHAAETGNEEMLKALARFARKSALEATLKLAESDNAVVSRVEDWDAAPYLLNCANGTVDLRDGKLREHRRDDRLTKSTGVAVGGDAPGWRAFLEHIVPDAEVRAYLQRAVGYSAIGAVTEHLLHIAWGGGANGKSVFFNAISNAMGDYAATVPGTLLVSDGTREHPTVVASLHGVRFALASETEENGKIRAAQLKQLTGGDTLTARRMREDFWSFAPSHTLWLQTNHKPQANDATYGFWRRVRLIPFNVTIPDSDQDKHLTAKLRKEAGGILQWIVEGAQQYLTDGLEPPEAIVAATAEYQHEEDDLAEFVECVGLVADDSAFNSTAYLYAIYERWANDGARKPWKRKVFSRKLDARYKPHKREGVRGFRVRV